MTRAEAVYSLARGAPRHTSRAPRSASGIFGRARASDRRAPDAPLSAHFVQYSSCSRRQLSYLYPYHGRLSEKSPSAYRYSRVLIASKLPMQFVRVIRREKSKRVVFTEISIWWQYLYRISRSSVVWKWFAINSFKLDIRLTRIWISAKTMFARMI